MRRKRRIKRKLELFHWVMQLAYLMILMAVSLLLIQGGEFIASSIMWLSSVIWLIYVQRSLDDPNKNY